MIESTFAFTPGGGGGNSYRFAEAMYAGAIPVVTADLLLAFTPEVNWDSCVIRVSESKIVSLPFILSSIPHEEIIKRRLACAKIRKVVFGDEQKLMMASMYSFSLKIWANRISSRSKLSKDVI
jgi:hypothetical protein